MAHRPGYSRAAVPTTLILLLVVSVMGAAVVYYIWSTTIQRTGHAIQIQSVAFQVNQTLVYVQNIGKGEVTLEAIIMGDQQSPVDDENCRVGDVGTNIVEEGETVTIFIDRGFSEKLLIRVVCSDGTFNEGYFQP